MPRCSMPDESLIALVAVKPRCTRFAAVTGKNRSTAIDFVLVRVGFSTCDWIFLDIAIAASDKGQNCVYDTGSSIDEASFGNAVKGPRTSSVGSSFQSRRCINPAYQSNKANRGPRKSSSLSAARKGASIELGWTSGRKWAITSRIVASRSTGSFDRGTTASTLVASGYRTHAYAN